MKNFYEQMNIASLLSQFDNDCHIKHCKILKVYLPTWVVRELKKQCIVKEPKTVECEISTFMGIPCEEDKTAQTVRYVVEGVLEL